MASSKLQKHKKKECQLFFRNTLQPCKNVKKVRVCEPLHLNATRSAEQQPGIFKEKMIKRGLKFERESKKALCKAETKERKQKKTKQKTWNK